MDEILRHPLASAALIALAIVVGAMLIRRPLRRWADAAVEVLRAQTESLEALLDEITPKVREMDRFLTAEFGSTAAQPRAGNRGDETAVIPRHVPYRDIDRSRLDPLSPDPQFHHFTVGEVITAIQAGLDPADPATRGRIAVSVAKLDELREATYRHPGAPTGDETQVFHPQTDDATVVQPAYRDSEPPTQYS